MHNGNESLYLHLSMAKQDKSQALNEHIDTAEQVNELLVLQRLNTVCCMHMKIQVLTLRIDQNSFIPHTF